MQETEIYQADFLNTLIFIIGAIIWVVRMITKANKNKANRPAGQSEPSTAQTHRNTRIPDILKDLFEENEAEEEYVEERKAREVKRKPVVEEVQSNRFSEYSGIQPVSVENKSAPKKRYEHYRIKKEKEHKYKKLLQTKKGMKQAVIASELLKRKF